MSIEVEKEPKEFLDCPAEHCFSCDRPTHFWYVKKDVPCCQICAKKVNDEDVPSKQEWIMSTNNREREKNNKSGLEKFFEIIADKIDK